MIGKKHNEILKWLTGTWFPGPQSIAVLEGFPGVGKTFLSREFGGKVSDPELPYYEVKATEASEEGLSDVVFTLAREMDLDGEEELSKMLDTNKSPVQALNKILTRPCLIVIDEFQKAMGESGTSLPSSWTTFLKATASRANLRGKILLLSNRTVRRADWAEHVAVREVTAFGPEDGQAYLLKKLAELGREDEVPASKRLEVINLLAGNPRAINLLVSNLTFNSLEELMHVVDDDWAYGDRYLSPELVEELENRLLNNILENINATDRGVLTEISPLRKPFGKEAFDLFFADPKARDGFRRNAIELFLMEQHRGFHALNPIAREAGLRVLYADPARLKAAHAKVAQYYLRYFRGQQLEGQLGKLGGYFAELKHHLAIADDKATLQQVREMFLTYLLKSYRGTNKVPESQQAVDELIFALSIVLDRPGPKGLETLLARLYRVRGSAEDLEKAIEHGKRALDAKNTSNWLMVADLLKQVGRIEKAVQLLRDGFKTVSLVSNLSSIYLRCASFLKEMGNLEEAEAVLIESLGIAPVQNRTELYIAYVEILHAKNDLSEAIAVLTEGIEQIPSEFNVRALYDYKAELLQLSGQREAAIELLLDGIKKVPVGKNLFMLYRHAAFLQCTLAQYKTAFDLLIEGEQRLFNRSEVKYLTVQRLLLLFGLQDVEALAEVNLHERHLTAPIGRLADILLSVLREEYGQAEELARTFSMRTIVQSFIFQYGGIALALSGQPEAGAVFLASRVKQFDRTGDLNAWLMACLHQQAGQTAEALTYLSSFLGTPKDLSPRATTQLLFDLWNVNDEAYVLNWVSLNFPLALPIFDPLLAPDDPRRLPFQAARQPTAGMKGSAEDPLLSGQVNASTGLSSTLNSQSSDDLEALRQRKLEALKKARLLASDANEQFRLDEQIRELEG